MPLIVDIKNLQSIKQELIENDPSDVREWAECKCEKCGKHVASDIAFKEPLYCIACGGSMHQERPQ